MLRPSPRILIQRGRAFNISPLHFSYSHCCSYCHCSAAPTFVLGRAHRTCPTHRQIIIRKHLFRLSERAYMSRVPIEPQRVDAPLTQSATFLVVTIADSPDATKTVRSTISSVDD